MGTSATITSQRARTQAAEDKLPWYVRYPVEGAGLALGLGTGVGELGLGERAAAYAAEKAAPYVSAKAAGRIGGAASGAVDTGIIGGVQGAGAAQSPSDAIGDALKGATEGAALGGVTGGVLGAGAKPAIVGAAAKDIPTLQAEKDAAYDVLKQTPVSSSAVNDAVTTGAKSLTPGERFGVSPQFYNKLTDIPNMGPNLSADDAESVQRALWDIAKRGFSPVDQKAAGTIGDNLLKLINPDDLAAAKTAHARLSDAQELPGLTINSGPKNAADWAQKRLDDPSMRYGAAEKQALQNLAQYADQPPPTGFWDTMKAGIGQTAQDKGLGYMSALGAHLGPIGAFAGPLAQAGAKAVAQSFKGNAIQKALDDAGATLTTGQLSAAGDPMIKRMLGNPKTRATALRLIQLGGAG